MEDKYKVIIEIPQGTVNNKYEYDEKSGEFKLDFVFSAKGGSASGGKNVVWPFNYGFFPGLWAVTAIPWMPWSYHPSRFHRVRKWR